MSAAARAASSDVVVAGAGLVGLACALAIADRGGNVLLLAAPRQGESSPAAAGMLAPSVEGGGGPVHRFAVAARDRFPGYLDALAERTGVRVPLNREGILVVALDAADDAAIDEARAAGGEPMDRRRLARDEPALAHARAAVLFAHDGAVDNRELLRALRAAVGAHPRVRVEEDRVVELALGGAESGAEVLTAVGARHPAARVVLAAGAWVAELRGLPRPLPVEPLRGQMLSLAAAPLRRVVYGPRGYLVPREDGRTLVGATMERVGFDASTTDTALDALRRDAEALCPALAGARRLEAWAGLRPVTPDFHPIIGPDPDAPALVYACGHSRNGVLMSPLTGDVVASIVLGETPAHDLAPFAVTRFA
ncbi:MAG: glycine oxidase ThiO [Gemmatimonadaceae bacterium]